MKITEIEGNVFDFLGAGDAFAHGVNCMGVMGAGIAKDVKARFPNNYKVYRDNCNTGMFKPGHMTVLKENDVTIYNLATQFMTGADAHLENVRVCARGMATHAKMFNVPLVKTVRLGCGIGGLDWENVRPVLEGINSDLELEVYYLV